MVQIVELAKNEADRLKALRLRALKEDPDAFGTTYEEALLWGDERWISQTQNDPTFIAFEGEEDIGMVRIWVDPINARVAKLIAMWVAPDARGNKLGERLIDAAIEWAKERRIEILKLDVGDYNKPAISLYERKGFKPNGETGSLLAPRSHITDHQREIRIL